MERRNFRASVRFTATEERAVQETAEKLKLNSKCRSGCSQVVKFGTLFFSGVKINPAPPQVRDHIRKLCWDTLKLEIFGVSKTTWDRLAKIFHEPKEESK